MDADLHPLLTHHVVNTLGWRSLRPLQQQAAGPITAGEHALVIAPTAGGKTEAAMFPVLSRMLMEDWSGLSVLYLCPLRALLNNLHPRLDGYCRMVGRRAGLWHGDVGESARSRIRSEPPDVLLTTPESIEAMLVSSKTEHGWLFKNLRAIVVDEIHAFVGDDRGWHLLAVAERLSRLAVSPVQRVGLSATVGNPERLVGWLTRTVTGPRRVVVPSATEKRETDVTVDYVGGLQNAATVISRLHRGEKRLVFVDSRARAEQLVSELTHAEVRTFLSHGSLGREERRAAEAAFAEARDCVIVATSTLELGIDVGDLDRVIQLDAPRTVAGFLQRLGRTGRRAGTTSNMLMLATTPETLARGMGLLAAWEDGFVEALDGPPLPLHLAVQQVLAVLLQEGGLSRTTLREWLGRPFVLGDDVGARWDGLIDRLLADNVLADDGGVIWLGPVAERQFGRRNFMDLMSVFAEPPLVRVLHGRREIGTVPVELLFAGQEGGVRLLLAGQSWAVRTVDWKRAVAQVELSEGGGRARWLGGGQGLSYELAQSVRSVLAGRGLQAATVSARAERAISDLREDHWWANEKRPVLVREADGSVRLWTFAGNNANAWIAAALEGLTSASAPKGDLAIRLANGVSEEEVISRLGSLDPAQISLGEQLAERAVDRLKFGDLLPDSWARQVIEGRMRADEHVTEVRSGGVHVVREQ